MNSCILLAEIIKDPELRFTSENQAIAEMLVKFSGLRPEDPPATLKVVGWGNLAQEIQERYHEGDRVVIEGRLSMNTIDRPEGFKEKRAELTAQKIHPLEPGAISSQSTPSTSHEDGATYTATSSTSGTRSASSGSSTKAKTANPTATESSPKSSTKTQSKPSTTTPPNLDDIPF